jgi:hypothetical protein
MTEQEWLECTDPTPMLDFLKDKLTDRKLRLFACVCCRRLWQLLDNRSRKSVEVSEQYADGPIDPSRFQATLEAAKEAWNYASAEAHQIFDERGFGDRSANAVLHAADAAYRIMWNDLDWGRQPDAGRLSMGPSRE